MSVESWGRRTHDLLRLVPDETLCQLHDVIERELARRAIRRYDEIEAAIRRHDEDMAAEQQARETKGGGG